MATCKPCLSTDLKKVLKGAVGDADLIKMIDKVSTCPRGTVMQLCPAGTNSRGAGPKTKRAPSAYNIFIGECMRSKPIKGKPFGAAAKFMKECSVEWKAKKAA